MASRGGGGVGWVVGQVGWGVGWGVASPTPPFQAVSSAPSLTLFRWHRVWGGMPASIAIYWMGGEGWDASKYCNVLDGLEVAESSSKYSSTTQ